MIITTLAAFVLAALHSADALPPSKLTNSADAATIPMPAHHPRHVGCHSGDPVCDTLEARFARRSPHHAYDHDDEDEPPTSEEPTFLDILTTDRDVRARDEDEPHHHEDEDSDPSLPNILVANRNVPDEEMHDHEDDSDEDENEGPNPVKDILIDREVLNEDGHDEDQGTQVLESIGHAAERGVPRGLVEWESVSENGLRPAKLLARQQRLKRLAARKLSRYSTSSSTPPPTKMRFPSYAAPPPSHGAGIGKREVAIDHPELPNADAKRADDEHEDDGEDEEPPAAEPSKEPEYPVTPILSNSDSEDSVVPDVAK